MSFLHPAAFAGLASIVVLILLSLWRQRARRVVVPSVRLWEKIADRLPPVRSLERPRASLSLLLQMLAAAVLVLAMAGPGIVRMEPAPRKIAVVVDLSAPMGPRLTAVRQELAKLDSSDEITLIESPSLIRREGLGSLQATTLTGDPGPALDLGVAESKTVIFISDRAPEWTPPPGVSLHLVLVGGELRNVGIADASVEGKRLFVRLTAASELSVSFDGVERVRESAAVHLVPVPEGAKRIEVRLPPDDFTLDDTVVLERAESRIDVGFLGRPDASILAAIESNPNARLVNGGKPRLLIRIGMAPEETAAAVVVDVDPRESLSRHGPPGEISLGAHPLVEGMAADDLKFTEVGTLEGDVEAPLMFSGGAPIAALRAKNRIVLAAKYASTGWPARPSFPIFWANVLRYAASGVVAWRAQGLLNESASRLGTERKPFVPESLDARPLAPRRFDLTGGALALAAALLAVLWFVESRQRE